ncbi:MAG: glycosyltransferase, partial [Actinomycetota bacterium]|nr:glycosyltransferase [Actinomycetota bacterium]
PGDLHPADRTRLLPRHVFLGSAVRSEPPDAEVEEWLEASDAPIVYVSLGSFLSVRSDVLALVAAALRGVGEGVEVRVAIASGSTPTEELGALPSSWLVRAVLPQITVLSRSVLAVSHGGNNSVTEALTAGVPLLLLPLSTDQFAAAAALEDAGFGVALDPNTATAEEIRDAALRLLDLDGEARVRLDRMSQELTTTPGAERARDALLSA